MIDLISRKALCEYINNTKDKTIDLNDVMRFPGAAVEIKQCKDCEWYKENKKVGLKKCIFFNFYPKENWYCPDPNLK